MNEVIVIVQTNNIAVSSLLRNHRGVNLTVETDYSMSRYALLSFSNRKVLEKVKRLFDSKGIKVTRVSEQPNWLHVDSEKVNIETFLAHLPNYLKEAGFRVILTKVYDYHVSSSS